MTGHSSRGASRRYCDVQRSRAAELAWLVSYSIQNPQKGECLMNLHLTRPKDITWIIALVLLVLGLIGKLGSVALLTQYAFWLVVAAAVLLLLAALVRGL
jgi:hypothetical protein